MYRRISILLLILLAFFTTTYAQENDTPRKPIIIDTDFAVDDWMAILYLLQHPDIEVRALILNGTGETHCDPGVQNAMNLLMLAGNPDIPVACGRETPLQGDHVFPDIWRENVDTMSGLTLPTNPNPVSEFGAVELLTEQITASAEPITLLTLGPLTNVAEALQATPTLIENIERIYIMGGAVNMSGNTFIDSNTAEWNIYIDPLATDIVFRAGAPITLVPLDATNQVPMTTAFYSRIANDHTTPEAEFVYQAMQANLNDITQGYMSFWDTLTSVALTDSSVITIQGRPISVVTADEGESGRTFVDGNGTRMDVAVGADAAAFELIFLNVLNGRDPATEPPAQISIAPGSEANAEIVQRYFEEGWGEQNRDTLTELLSENYILHNNASEYPSDISGVIGTSSMLHYIAPDLELTIEEIIVVNDSAAARIILSGTSTVGYADLPPTGFPFTVAINSILHLRDGRIIEEWQTYDWFNFFAIIGVYNSEEVLAPLFENGDE